MARKRKRRKNSSGLTVTLQSVPTDDAFAPGKKDVIAIRGGREIARWPWHYKSKPTRSRKTVTINGVRYKAKWRRSNPSSNNPPYAGMSTAEGKRVMRSLRPGDKIDLKVRGKRAVMYTMVEADGGATGIAKRGRSEVLVSHWDFSEGFARKHRKGRRANRRSNFASGMRYIRNLPPATRKPPYAFTGPPYGGRMPRTKNAPSTHSLTKDQRHLLQWMNRNGGISDGKYTKQDAKTKRVLKQLHRRKFLRKKGRVGQNARYTMTTKGYNALGKVKGVKVKRSR